MSIIAASILQRAVDGVVPVAFYKGEYSEGLGEVFRIEYLTKEENPECKVDRKLIVQSKDNDTWIKTTFYDFTLNFITEDEE